MRFHVGDQVVHPNHGVGTIVGYGEQKFYGNQPRWYYEVHTPRSTFWVEAVEDHVNGLRHLTSVKELAPYRDVLRSQPNLLSRDYRERHDLLVNRLKDGTLQAICEVVRDLTGLSWSKTLRDFDATALRRAHDILCEEWAAAYQVELDTAARDVDALLDESRLQYKELLETSE